MHQNDSRNLLGILIPRFHSQSYDPQCLGWGTGIYIVNECSKRIRCGQLLPLFNKYFQGKNKGEKISEECTKVGHGLKNSMRNIKTIPMTGPKEDLKKERERRLETAPPGEEVHCVVTGCSLSPPGQMKSRGL